MAEEAIVGGVIVRVEKTDDGLNISVGLPEGQHNAWHDSYDGGIDMVTRDVALPMKGQRVKVNGRVHKVRNRTFDESKHCWITDEDTGERVLWA